MKKHLMIALVATMGCIKPTEPVEVHAPPMQIPSDVDAPTPDFTISCDEDKVCLFDAINSKQTLLPIDSYGWSFGDASVYITKETAIQHTYKEKGIYTVMLTVWDTQQRGGRLYKQFEIK
jgi:PKD repeat protein